MEIYPNKSNIRVRILDLQAIIIDFKRKCLLAKIKSTYSESELFLFSHIKLSTNEIPTQN